MRRLPMTLGVFAFTAFAALLGSWNEKVEADKSVIRELIEGHD